MFAFGTPTSRTGLAETLEYHLRDGIAEAISCPTLVLDAEGAHCQVGANRLAFARIYNRVDETLKP